MVVGFKFNQFGFNDQRLGFVAETTSVSESLKRSGGADRRWDFPRAFRTVQTRVDGNLDVDIGHDVWIGGSSELSMGWSASVRALSVGGEHDPKPVLIKVLEAMC